MTLPSLPLQEALPLINLCAAILLLLGFAMLSQRRILTLINLFMMQGFVLFCSTLIVAVTTNQTHLYWSAALTLALQGGGAGAFRPCGDCPGWRYRADGYADRFV